MARKTVRANRRSAAASTATARHPGPCPIVAIGASAGGLEAFQQFFQRIPSDTGMAFALVQHLDPNHDTLIAELLAKYTAMPVRHAEDGARIEANCIYVVRPQTRVTLDGCVFRVVELGARSVGHMPIDDFFRSVAEDQTHNAVGVVLSGNGSDGTIGLQEIKACGGLTLAQAVDTAKHPGMPASAIAAGVVDHALPLPKMAARIIEYAGHLRRTMGRGDQTVEDWGTLLQRVFPILRRRTGHDFSRYRQSTLVRRIQRRMQLHYLASLDDYVLRLEADGKEVDELFKDLLIGVTHFFRDPEAFESLAERVVAPLLQQRTGPDAQFRIWVPGCATGEEAYSIAMLFAEASLRLQSTPRMQVFATDLDSAALEVARRGLYPESITEHVSEARLKAFFNKRPDGYEVGDQLRSMCVFSPHNLTKDPPFSRLDLLSCRNLLIYFEVELQKKLLPLFHYALLPSGYLFLGPSENVASRSELFRTIDKRHRIFQRNAAPLRAAALSLIEAGRPVRTAAVPLPAMAAGGREQNVTRTIERVVLEEFALPSVVVNEQGDAVYFSGRLGTFIQPAAGNATHKLVNMVHKGLRLELRTALHRAITTRQEVVREGITLRRGRRNERVRLLARPLIEVGREAGLFIVVFQELPPASGRGKGRSSAKVDLDLEHPMVQQLENELRSTREDLQTTIEELETSNEELKSANEELLSMNEELQSTNEELQTSKEELQSLNDELQRKVEELDSAHADLQNLFESTRIGTLFLDSQMRIKRFTPALCEILPLTERDIGRHIGEAAPQLLRVVPIAQLEEVYRTLARHERHAHFNGDRWYVVRALAYQSLEHEAQGVVITFNDVTELKRAETERGHLAAIVESSEDAIVGQTTSGIITSWNAGAERMYGYTAREMIGRPWSTIVPADRAGEVPAFHERLFRGEPLVGHETKRLTKSGALIDVSLTLSAIRDRDGRVVGFSAITRDITERKRTAEVIARSHQLLKDFVENATEGMHWVAPGGTIIWANKAELEMLGYQESEYVGHHIARFHVDRPAVEEMLDRLLRGEKLTDFETRVRCKDGTIRHVLINSDVYWENGRFVHTRCFTRDVTARKVAEDRLREQTRVLEILNEVGSKLAGELDLERLVQAVTDAGREVTGAEFGAFFYNVVSEQGESFTLYTLSGVPRERFADMPMPRNTPLFGPTFRGEGIIRCADVLQDERYGRNAPFHGMPPGHLPVRSYLAAPVVSRSGEVVGGLFFGHSQPGVFTDRAERLLAGIAGQAAVAIDNARLYQTSVRAEAALRLTEQQLRAIIGASPDCIKVVARDGTVLEMNPAGLAMFGAANEADIVGRVYYDLIAPESRSAYAAMHERVCAGESARLEYQAVGLNGVRRWMETRAVPLHDPKRGEILHLAVTRDTTDRKRVEEALRESETRFRQLADSMPQIVWSARADGHTDYYNRRWYEYTGLPENVTGDESFTPAIHPDDLARCLERWYYSVRSGEPYQIEYRFKEAASGTYRWQLGRALPIRDSEGRVVRWFGTCTDIHDHKLAQEALARAQEQLSRHSEELERQVAQRTATLNQTVQSLEGVCYTMAHDLRAPLRALQSFTEILATDHAAGFDGEGRLCVERILAATARMDQLIRDLLEFARLSHSDLPATELDLNTEVELVLKQLTPEIDARQASVRVNGSLPTVLANRTLLEQVLVNLMTNALKFTRPDIQPQVEISGGVADGFGRFCIRDNGIGIPPEFHQRIFGLFQRLHTTEAYPGTGVGLAIVRKGVERMGGRVTIESTPEHGSCFCVELPLPA